MTDTAQPRQPTDAISELADPVEADWKPPALSSVVLAVALVAAGIVFVMQSLAIRGSASDAAGPKFFSLWISVLWTAFAIGYLVIQTTQLVRERAEASSASESTTAAAPPRRLVLAMVGACVTLLGYAYLIDPLGYLPATALAMFLFCRLTGSRQWRRDAVISVLVAAAIYFLFTKLVGIYLPAGVLPL